MSYMDIIYQLKNILLANPHQSITYSIIAYIAFKISSKIIKAIQHINFQSKLIKQANEIRSRRDERVRKFVTEYQNSNDVHKKIIDASILTLKEYLKKKEVTSREIVISYATRCADVGLGYNLIADADFESALIEAEEDDNFMKNNDYEKWPPLLGIPISIKDSFHIEGLLSTLGYISQTDKPAKEDAYLVRVLKQLGAIPFVKSNIPQGVMAAETKNKIWGEALNPWNRKKTVGGSSGGEAGLVASRCSPGGFGNDIGGSIRIPASFCGVYALKPSSRRISLEGLATLSGDKYSGFSEIRVSNGPFGRTVDDVIFMCKHLFGKFERDEEVNNKPFSHEVFTCKKNLKIGYISSNDSFEIANCTIAAIEDCKEKLKKKGHKIVPFPITKIKAIIFNYLDVLYGGQIMQELKKGLKGEELLDLYEDINKLSTYPPWLLRFLKNIFYYVGMDRDYELLSNLTLPQSTSDYIEVCQTHQRLKAEFKNFWLDEEFDALICPVTQLTALNLSSSKSALHFFIFTMLFNSLDMPGGVVPVGLATDNEIKPIKNDKHFKSIVKSVEDSIGMPVAIQVVTMTNNDELCLRVMKEVDEIYRFDQNHASKVFEVLNN